MARGVPCPHCGCMLYMNENDPNAKNLHVCDPADIARHETVREAESRELFEQFKGRQQIEQLLQTEQFQSRPQKVSCSKCEGSGRLFPVGRLTEPAPRGEGMTCFYCEGTGEAKRSE